MEGKIYEAINKVMSDIGVVQKNGENTFDKYKYRRIDDVMNALNPAMVKNHVFVTPTVLESTRQERQSQKGQLMMYTVMKVKYTFFDNRQLFSYIADIIITRKIKFSYPLLSRR